MGSEENGIRNLSNHWDSAYANRPTEDLGWYEEDPEPSLRLIKKSGIGKDAGQLHVGVGSSLLIDSLLEEGYTGLIANDLSPKALGILKQRLGAELARKVEWVVDDLSAPQVLDSIEPVDLWHDRAVLHFLTKEEDRRSYVDLIRSLVKPGGFVIIGVFNLSGAEKCNGLPVHRYDSGMLVELLGKDFDLLEQFDFIFQNPRGEPRPYVYTMFKRKSNQTR